MISQTRCFNFSTDNENNVMPSKLPDSGFVSPDSENWRKMSQELENHNISYDELRWKQSCLKNGTITINEVNTEFDSVTMKNGNKEEVSMALKCIFFNDSTTFYNKTSITCNIQNEFFLQLGKITKIKGKTVEFSRNL